MVEATESRGSAARSEPGPTEGRRSRRRRELHQSILATAAELFARDGFEATTVETIAAAADIAPATFFNHFPSKEDVLREVGQDVFSRFHRLVDEQLERPVTTVERLRGFASRSGRLVRRAPEMTRRVLTAVLRTSRPGEAGDELASMQADFVRLLEEGRRNAEDNIRADLDIELTAEILVSVVMGSMTHWINDAGYPLEEKMSSALALLGDKLLAPDGASAPSQSASRSRSSRSPTTSAPSNPSNLSKRRTP